ncbi:acetylcholine receptor [Homalodisca vitripennis]|nr:acetylcholine receptor [Homalodisca vitripennis]
MVEVDTIPERYHLLTRQFTSTKFTSKLLLIKLLINVNYVELCLSGLLGVDFKLTGGLGGDDSQVGKSAAWPKESSGRRTVEACPSADLASILHTSTIRYFTSVSSTSKNWNDVHLSWDKLQHDDIGSIMLDTSMIWVPDLSIYNSRQEIELNQEVGSVAIASSGDAYALFTPEMTGHCVPNYVNWPYDIHKCNITLGSKRYMGSIVNFTFFYEDVRLLSILF